MKRGVAILLSGMCALSGLAQANAQDVLSELYGQGVHAYFAGRLDEAEQSFNEAINAGSQDPRVYFFRGLTQAKRSGEVAGIQDYQTAAELEATSKRSVPSDVISKSLTRIQGRQRLEIEKARGAARLAARGQQALLRREAEAAAAAQNRAGAAALPAVDGNVITGGAIQGDAKEMAAQPNVAPEVVPPVANQQPAVPEKAVDPFKDDAPQPAPTEQPKPAEDPFDPFK